MAETTESELCINLWASPSNTGPDIVTVNGKLQERFIEIHLYRRSSVYIVDGITSPRVRMNNRSFIDRLAKRDFDSQYLQTVLKTGQAMGYL